MRWYSRTFYNVSLIHRLHKEDMFDACHPVNNKYSCEFPDKFRDIPTVALRVKRSRSCTGRVRIAHHSLSPGSRHVRVVCPNETPEASYQRPTVLTMGRRVPLPPNRSSRHPPLNMQENQWPHRLRWSDSRPRFFPETKVAFSVARLHKLPPSGLERGRESVVKSPDAASDWRSASV